MLDFGVSLHTDDIYRTIPSYIRQTNGSTSQDMNSAEKMMDNQSDQEVMSYTGKISESLNSNTHNNPFVDQLDPKDAKQLAVDIGNQMLRCIARLLYKEDEVGMSRRASALLASV